MRCVHGSCVWHIPPLAPSLLAGQKEGEQSVCCFSWWKICRSYQILFYWSLTFCTSYTLEWCTIILPKCPHLLVLNLTIFQVFVSLRQNDQELASMYDQVILNIAFNSFIPPLFSSESHGQPQKLYGRSDGGGKSCPRGQNFGKIQFIYRSCRLSVLSSLIPP